MGRVFHSEALESHAVLEVLGQDATAPRLPGRSNDLGVPERESLEDGEVNGRDDEGEVQLYDLECRELMYHRLYRQWVVAEFAGCGAEELLHDLRGHNQL